MNQDFVAKYEAGKEALREQFAKAHPDSYKHIVESVIRIINPDEGYDAPDPSKIHEIDDGSYQGTLVYVIPEYAYQPSDYWYVKVGYGSCSGCDTLEAIRSYADDPPTEEQVADYMTLALHIVQGLKKMDGEYA